MANKLYEEASVQAIAQAIREKNGGTSTYKVSEMAEAVRAIQTGSETAEYSWNQIPTAVKNFLDSVTYDPSDYSTSRIGEFAPATANINNTYPIGKTIETEAGVLDRNGYEIAVQNGNTVLYNDIPNQYTEYVVRNGGAVSQVGILKPTGALRQIKCVTANVRDLGGWACDGGTVKYGKLFRGGEIAEADIDIFVNQLGIRQELNLRGVAEAGNKTVSILGSEIGYVCTKDILWYSLTNTTDWKTTLRCVFDSITSNKPVFFHCSAGADRTGTVACILEAILGVSQSDMDKDYELTTFMFGNDTDTNARRRNEADWKGLINQINALSVGSTFRDKVINWVASLGFTVDEINAFRNAMIEGTPDTITLSIGTHSITNTLSNVNNNNAETSVVKYQPYNADITVPEGYTIDSIKVTMGGTDITATAFKGSRTNLYRGITKNLSNCSIDNPKGVVIDGEGYVANITANDGYTLEGGTVILTMGGINIMANYYSDGKIAIPNVTGDVVITATAVETAPPTVEVPIVFNEGKTCNYSVGQSMASLSSGSSYCTSDLFELKAGVTYTLHINATAASSFRLVGGNDSGVVTELCLNTSFAKGENTFTFTPSSGTTQARIRTYAGFSNSEWKLTYEN